MVNGTFFKKQEETMQCWIDQRHGRYNLYFHVNVVKGSLAKKADKSEIIQCCALHVDIDLPGKKPREIERQEALKRLRECTPKPSIIINSGNGFQAYWLLKNYRTIRT